LIEEAAKHFKRVKLLPLSQMPRALRLEYCDIWELSQPLRLAGKGAGKARGKATGSEVEATAAARPT